MRFGFAAAAMALLSSVRGFFGIASLPIVSLPQAHRHSGGSRRIRLGGRTYKPNGAREVARRQRQIADGKLTASNGLTL